MKNRHYGTQARSFKAAIILSLVLSAACNGFLEVKPDKRLAVPSSAENLQAMLDNLVTMNLGYAAGLGEVAADDVMLPYPNWRAILSESYRMNYIWDGSPVDIIYWDAPYRRILAANTVIGELGKLESIDAAARDLLHGAALLFRGYGFFDLLQVFSVPYHTDAGDRLGIPIRLTADVNEVSRRSSLEASYGQVISDLVMAASKLPDTRHEFPTRPDKAAAYGALARVYLAMGRYDRAGSYADSCLALRDSLIDFNDVRENTPYPVPRFNPETIFYLHMSGAGVMSESRARIDTPLFASYGQADLRKSRFFTKKADGYMAFTGDYGLNTGSEKFHGITTAEMLLVSAECAARYGDVGKSLRLMDRIRWSRYDNKDLDGLRVDDFADADGLLRYILEERRKELVFRGVRWTDVRRLARDPAHAVSLKRVLDGQVYRLSSVDLLDFAFRIPQKVIDFGIVVQNP